MSITVELDKIDIRKLTIDDDTASFDCKEQELNEYIRDEAKKQQRDGAAVVYLAWYDAQLVGFVSLNMSSIRFQNIASQHLPSRTPYPYFPALMIGRVATEKMCQNQGVGRLLCLRAVAMAVRLRREIGCQFVILNAKKNSIDFYKRCGFELGTNQPKRRRTPFMYFKLLNIEYCQKCRRELEPYAKFCIFCGTEQTPQSSPSDDPTKSNSTVHPT